MLTSVFFHHKDTPNNLTVYILQSDLTKEDKDCLLGLADEYGQNISFVQAAIDERLLALPTTELWSKETYYRLLAGELLPDTVTRLLYLDVDVIVNRPLYDLYDMDLTGMDLAAVDDPIIPGHFSDDQQKLFAGFDDGIRYFNAGVILFDLKKIRAKYTFEAYCEIAADFSYRLTNQDQDLLNYVHAGHVCYLPDDRYNLFAQLAETKGGYDYVRTHGAIVHYAGRKPWKYNGVHYEAEKLWWDYAKLTPFYYEFMESVFLSGLKDASYQTIMTLLQENQDLKKGLTEATQLCQKLFQMIDDGSASS